MAAGMPSPMTSSTAGSAALPRVSYSRLTPWAWARGTLRDRRLLRWGIGRCGTRAQQFDFEQQHLVGQRALPAVGQLRRDCEFELAAFLHELQGLGPTGDHAADRERGRLPALVRTV